MYHSFLRCVSIPFRLEHSHMQKCHIHTSVPHPTIHPTKIPPFFLYWKVQYQMSKIMKKRYVFLWAVLQASISICLSCVLSIIISFSVACPLYFLFPCFMFHLKAVTFVNFPFRKIKNRFFLVHREPCFVWLHVVLVCSGINNSHPNFLPKTK